MTSRGGDEGPGEVAARSGHEGDAAGLAVTTRFTRSGFGMAGQPLSLYDQVGGAEALAAAVAVFYRRVLADPSLAPWFADVDLRRLKSHQRAFLAAALGGPDLFAGRDLGKAHAGLGITDTAFDAVADHLACTLRDLGVDTDVVARIDEHVGALRSLIVSIERQTSTGGTGVPRGESEDASSLRGRDE